MVFRLRERQRTAQGQTLVIAVAFTDADYGRNKLITVVILGKIPLLSTR